jgi:hypothetical protein
MAEFRIFPFLDEALLKAEISAPYASRTPAVWPSEASAVRTDRSLWNIVGKCNLAAFYRLIGMSLTNPANVLSAWKWWIGRDVESHITELAKSAGVYVASGVKHWIPDVMLAIEMDAVTLDPATNDPYVVEVKSFAGYYATKEIITENKPKLENLIQICLYLLEAQNGKHLKEIIRKSLADRARLDANRRPHRNRCEADLKALEMMSDNPVKGKLVYVDRGEAERKEFTIEIFEEFDGCHYPMVDGVPFKIFTLESVYDRYKTLQTYWFAARAEAVRRLNAKGITPPDFTTLVLDPRDIQENMEPRTLTAIQRTTEATYFKQLEQTVRDLAPDQFFPPPEYEWSYTPERIETLFAAKAIGKTKYTAYKKDKIQRIGDWQCLLSGTPVEMTDGSFKSIETVTTKPADREVVAIKPYNLPELLATSDHQVMTSSGRFVEAAHLTPFVGGYGTRRIGRVEGDELVVPFDTAETTTALTERELFIVGLWLAEGHFHMLSKDGSKYFKHGFTLHPREEVAAQQIKLFAAQFTNRWGKPATVTDRVKVDPRNGHTYRALTVNSVEATAFIQKWTQGHSSSTKALVLALRRAPVPEQACLLGGLKYGDGCTSPMRGAEMHVYTSVSRQLALDVQRLLWRAGKVAGVVSQDQTGLSTNRVYHVRWYVGPSWASRIENGLFYTKIKRLTRNVPYDGMVYDLTIKDSKQIPTASGIVHNCSPCSYLGHCAKRQRPDLQYTVNNLLELLSDENAEVEIAS